ncbi:hypothetical protein D0865_09850 [Hortaea werneckii]|uniref:NAD-dependent epimerase/dehydratase domain-containing protein n=1 Tax=Hortaea werneckii TaxID=91943 RepID=A0A3M7C1J0_HORWE|nr:hypothetical protein D0865_09850 [Hortaea werneckii]
MTAEESLLTIRSDGIYHGLPVFPENFGGLTAIITGANGIPGTHMLRVLCKHPKRWSKIYALSRRAPYMDLPPHVEHVTMDLLQSPEQIARQLKEGDIKADLCSFLHISSLHLLQDAPPGGLAGANAVPKRVLLQLGAKYYGVHLGPTTIPQEESDARVLLEPNFYYDQEDYLKRFCEEHHCAWNTTRPSWVPGAAPNAAMNLVYPLAVYGAIQKHLNRPLVYPGDLKSCFNAGDDSPFITWGKFRPKFANYLGIAYEGPQIDASGLLEEHSGQSTLPRGWGPVGTIRYRFKLADWAKQPEVSAAWKEIAEDDTELRKNGFFGFVDSTESIFKVFEEFVGLDMLPDYFSG